MSNIMRWSETSCLDMRGGAQSVKVSIEERRVNVVGFKEELSIEYLTGGEGPPLVLLHGVGDSARSWQWVLPDLARTHRVYAPSLPGFGTSTKPDSDYSPAFFTTFLIRFLDTLGLEQVTVVGNSLGGLVAMRLALAVPTRVRALALVDSSGLGREVTLALRLFTLPGAGTLVPIWNKTRIGAAQWATQISALLFAHPTRVPMAWLARLYQMARLPGYLEATVATLRSDLTLKGQREREIMLDALPRLTMPTLLIWGGRDRVIPAHQAQFAVAQLAQSQLAVIPDCGHVPQVECPDQFVDALGRFLAEQALSTRA
jgi:pimeloyl-ACP methyl ester carboxylesterase